MDAAPIFDADLFGNPLRPALGGELAKRFLFPPFTVLNAREGVWQDRKKAWLRLGIRSEIGRGANIQNGNEFHTDPDYGRKKTALERELGRALSHDEAVAELVARGDLLPSAGRSRTERLDSGAGRDGNLLGLSPQAEDYRTGSGAYAKESAAAKAERERARKATTPGGGGGPNTKYNRGAKKPDAKAFNIGMNASKDNNWTVEDNQGSGTSIFDPVLCELLYSWFVPAGGQVIDPFAGGSVRGIVSACLGRPYWGCDLSAPQIAANVAQIGLIPPGCPTPVWVNGDSVEQVPYCPDADFVIACPPYYDLEVYSDDKRDLSQMSWEGFRGAYRDIIGLCGDALRNDRFAAFVIGDVRDEDGNYRNLDVETITAFEAAGMKLYNRMVLITAVGSLSIRTERQFVMSRKLGKTHQDVLIFVKGDARRAADAVSGTSAAERRAALEQRAEARKKSVAGPED